MDRDEVERALALYGCFAVRSDSTLIGMNKASLIKLVRTLEHNWAATICDLHQVIKNVEDWGPIHHAHWNRISRNEWYCTYCGMIIKTENGEMPYKKFCDECGARMDEEETDESSN